MLNLIPPAALKSLMSLTFFPNSIGPSFIIGLRDSLYVAIAMSVAGAILSALSGGRYVHGEGYTNGKEAIKKDIKKNVESPSNDPSSGHGSK